jgi:hypothetical protein
LFDIAPYLAFPAFDRLPHAGFFAQARASRGTVTWPDGTDFCPDTLYRERVPAPDASP